MQKNASKVFSLPLKTQIIARIAMCSGLQRIRGPSGTTRGKDDRRSNERPKPALRAARSLGVAVTEPEQTLARAYVIPLISSQTQYIT